MRPDGARGAAPEVFVRAVALPPEHGGWGFLLEPLLLGLLVAPSLAGAGLAIAAIGAFLARHPLKLVLSDRLRGRRYPRTYVALRFVAAYGLVSVAGFGIALARARAVFWLPLLAAAPMALLQLHHDARNGGRAVLPELLGAAAPGAMASAVVLARGWALGPALALWLILATRAVASVLYVRARLRLDRGARPDTAAVWATHLAGLLLVGGLAAGGYAPWLAFPAFALLLGRAALGLSPLRRPCRPQALGVSEMGFGVLTALLLAFGYGSPS